MTSSSTNISTDLNDKLVEYLNEALSAENAAVDRLQSRIEECFVPEGRRQLQHHLEETRQHQSRLEQIIHSRGGTPTDTKAGLPTLRLPTTMMAKKVFTDVSKAIAAEGETNAMQEELELMRTKEDFGIENVEIMSYRTLIQACERLGIQDAIVPLQQTLKEEENMANWISTNLPIIFNTIWPKIESAIEGYDKEQAGQVR